MSLFDFIENKSNTPLSSVSTPPKTNTNAVRYQSKTKPEKLKFLKPCPLCEGQDFICTKKGSFFCIKCNPGVAGSPVIAKGSWDMPKIAPSSDLEPDNTQEESKEEKRPTQMDTHGLYFKAAFPWIMEHLAELQKAGWTRPALFRRGKQRFPLGAWGVAWFPIWTKSTLEINICRRSGAIRFAFTGTDGRTISQAAYPPQPITKHQLN